MISLELPRDEFEETYALCVNGVQDRAMPSRFLESAEELARIATSYSAALEDERFEDLRLHEQAYGSVTKDDMVWLYENRFVDGPGRVVYNRMFMSSKYNRCPYCMCNGVKSIDHYVGKSVYPMLAVTPANLVPSCSDCNKNKSDKIITGSDDLILHPYFDRVDVRWLYAKFIEAELRVSFYFEAPLTYSDKNTRRLENHFNQLKLASLYADLAAVDMTSLKFGLSKTFIGAGADGVHDWLSDEAKNPNRRINTWQTAMYDALAANEFYCSGGFDAI